MKRITCTKFDIYVLYYYDWVDISDGELLVPKGILRSVVTASLLAWFIRYICYKKNTVNKSCNYF